MSYRSVVVIVAALAALLATIPVLAASQQFGNSTKTTLVAKKGGEALLDLTASAPDTDWGASGSESAVVTVTLDGKYNPSGSGRYAGSWREGRVSAPCAG